MLVFLWDLNLTECPKIYFRCGRAGSCPDQKVTGWHKPVLVLAMSVLYPSVAGCCPQGQQERSKGV